jgi:uncharacterized protein (DUF1330 family)
VILQFESIEQAKKWPDLEEYRAARKMRHQTAHSNLVVIEGL